MQTGGSNFVSLEEERLPLGVEVEAEDLQQYEDFAESCCSTSLQVECKEKCSQDSPETQMEMFNTQ